jgi:hypothetical protein
MHQKITMMINRYEISPTTARASSGDRSPST